MVEDSFSRPVPVDEIANVSPPREKRLNERELRSALAMHARLTRPGSSYEQVAREIGFVVMVAGLVWVIIGAPGVPAVQEFASDALDEVAANTVLVFATLAAVVVSGMAGLISPPLPYPASLLCLPGKLLLGLLRTATLLAGIACVGIVALVPANAVAHLLGF